MFRPLELFIGLRYTRAKRRNQFISFISGVSIVCITISVMALITVMSVMNGFDFQLRSRILNAISDVTVSSAVPGGLRHREHVLELIHANTHVRAAAPYVNVEVFLQGRGSSGAILRGIDTALEPKVSSFNQHMLDGSFESLRPGRWNILLGNELAMMLGVTVGDRVIAVVPQLRATPLGALPLMRSFHVSGIYSLGMHDYDANLALIDLHDAEKLRTLAGPTGIRLKLDNLWHANMVAGQLSRELGRAYVMRTWTQDNANFFSAISMEKQVMGVILSLIVLVAVINLVSMLMMMVTDKQADIAILRTLGVTPRSIMGTFMVQGVLVSLVGIGLGVLLGSLLSWKLPVMVDSIQNMFHVQFLSPDVYYISQVPSRLEAYDVAWVTLVTFVFSLLATLYPAWRASRTAPAQALRYE